jgi:hypothetical protein
LATKSIDWSAIGASASAETVVSSLDSVAVTAGAATTGVGAGVVDTSAEALGFLVLGAFAGVEDSVDCVVSGTDAVAGVVVDAGIVSEEVVLVAFAFVILYTI